MITKELRYLTWEEAFLSLRSDILPEAIRAKYCDLTTSNCTVLEHYIFVVLHFTRTSFTFNQLIHACLISRLLPLRSVCGRWKQLLRSGSS